MAYENGIITTAGGETYDVSEVVEPLAIKVEDATEGNFAGLDENGNLTDSGSKAGDFANAEHTHSSLKNGNGVASIPEFSGIPVEMTIVSATVVEQFGGEDNNTKILTLTVAGNHVAGLTPLIYDNEVSWDASSDKIIHIKFPNETHWDIYNVEPLYGSFYMCITSATLIEGNTVIVLNGQEFGPPGAYYADFTASDLIDGFAKLNGYTMEEQHTVALAPKTVTTGTNITLADNTEYRLTDVSTLTLTYPTGSFEVWMRITTATEGAITITLPTSTYIGDAPSFGNGETWELSIKDGVVIAQKAGA